MILVQFTETMQQLTIIFNSSSRVFHNLFLAVMGTRQADSTCTYTSVGKRLMHIIFFIKVNLLKNEFYLKSHLYQICILKLEFWTLTFEIIMKENKIFKDVHI